MPSPNYCCDQCGKEDYKKPSALRKNKNNYCSLECSYKAKVRKQEVVCLQCDINFFKKLSEIENHPNHFCSEYCSNQYKSKKQEVVCLVCKKPFLKKLSEILRRERHCCSKECAVILQRYFKNWGSNRSKLEKAIEKHLTEIFSFTIDYNKTDIGYELDIYIPHLNQAIEINGIFHYEPIFGKDELLRRQKVDKLKAEECIKRNINLIVINVSKDKQSKKVMTQRINEVVDIIRERINLYSEEAKPVQLCLEI